jgi:hypothetical protein
VACFATLPTGNDAANFDGVVSFDDILRRQHLVVANDEDCSRKQLELPQHVANAVTARKLYLLAAWEKHHTHSPVGR